MKKIRKWFTVTPADAQKIADAAAVLRCSEAQLMRNAALDKAEAVLRGDK